MSRLNLSYLKNLVLAIVGIPCGVLTGVTGLSCAPVVQPALRWLIGLEGPSLAGVVLMMISFAAWSAMLSFGQSDNVDWFNGFVLTFGTFFGAALAARAVLKYPVQFVKSRPIWSFLPLASALVMVSQSLGLVPHFTQALLPNQGLILPPFWSLIIGTGIGFIGAAGELGSMMTVPALLFLLGRNIWEAEGTALFVLVLASLPTALIHALRRSLNTNAALAISAGGLFGALFGSHLAVKNIQDNALIFLCGVVLGIFSLMSLFQRPVVDTTTVKEDN